MTKRPTTTDSDSETGISWVAWSVALVGLGLTIGAGFLGGFRTLLGVGVGALIANLNLFALAFLVRRLITPSRPSGHWAGAAVLKLLLLLGAVFLLVKSGRVEVLALIIGYGALPLGIVVGQIATPNPPARRDGAPAEKEN